MKWCKKEKSFCSWFYSFNFSLKSSSLRVFVCNEKR
nr:MAG TPA: hypothetical protein [Caudoviricetes sp.]